MTVTFIGGGNRSTRRKPPTCRKSLTNFITYCCIEYTSSVWCSNSQCEHSGTCLIRHTKGPGKCVGLYRSSENSGVGLHKFHCTILYVIIVYCVHICNGEDNFKFYLYLSRRWNPCVI